MENGKKFCGARLSYSGKSYETEINHNAKEWDEYSDSMIKNYCENDYQALKEQLEKSKEEIHKKVIEVLSGMAEVEMHLDFMKDAENFKKKNKTLQDHIKKLIDENKMNVYYRKEGNNDLEYIENGTYHLFFRTFERMKGNVDVTYVLSVQDLLQRDAYGRFTIQSVRSCFKNREDAEKYIAGRKKAYSEYFQEIQPPLVDNYKNLIEMYGMRFDGYTLVSENK